MNLGIVVTNKNFKKSVKEIMKSKVMACDTETTGLKAFLGNRLFSLIIRTEIQGYYFNFNTLDAIFLSKYCELVEKKTGIGYVKRPKIITVKKSLSIPTKYILDYEKLNQLRGVFKDPKRIVYFHNAKFDMHFLAKEGIEFRCVCFCTENGSRLVKNDLPTYTLSYMSKLIGEYKSDAVTKYIKEHKLADKETGEKHYERVEFSIMSEYGLRDGLVTYKLGEYIRKRIKIKDKEVEEITDLRLQTVLNNELNTTKALYNMEHEGFLCYQSYTKKAFNYAVKKYKKCESEFGAMTGLEFSDGELTLVPAFKELGLAYGHTKGGKPSFADSVLEALDHPLATLIQEHREWYKKAHTYFEPFLKLSDSNGRVHCNFRQGGTLHGRLSCSDPNLQNVPKELKDKKGKFLSKYPVRRCFVPREGYFFLMPDYDQMEYRLLFDYANEKSMTEQILAGVDVHTATKETMGVNDSPVMSARDIAKRINFLLVYGGGAVPLAINLFRLTIDEALLKEIWEHMWKDKLNQFEIASRCNIEDKVADFAYNKLNEAMDLKRQYFSKLPKVKKFITQVQDAAKNRGYIFNWYGRRCHFNQGHEYKAPNHLISGGCADIVKIAMVEIDRLLIPYKSKMLIQVHDELIFEIKYGEEELIPKIKTIMEKVYPYHHIPLTVGVDYSQDSWADKEGWTG